ncbi:hypothetical protein SCHPADRAFT_487100 [Schizopora paradoxa]|uniref:Uncharacterized protein n=1 Tax=Schizopora paradoxa TaxID=27342 RepID=A0A0H2S2A1_9AGAM|nr:hypothetical protein SCHPADRAFT_487100 [Schizopora paradoxa]
MSQKSRRKKTVIIIPGSSRIVVWILNRINSSIRRPLLSSLVRMEEELGTPDDGQSRMDMAFKFVLKDGDSFRRLTPSLNWRLLDSPALFSISSPRFTDAPYDAHFILGVVASHSMRVEALLRNVELISHLTLQARWRVVDDTRTTHLVPLNTRMVSRF